MPQIVITIHADAEVKVEAKGVTGSGCKALTKAIEESLGSVKSDATKPEFFTAGKQTQQVNA